MNSSRPVGPPFEPAPKVNPEFLLVGEQEGEAAAPTVSLGLPPPGVEDEDRSSTPTVSELVALGATDSLLYCKAWFPKTFRQGFAKYARNTWDILDDPNKRLCNIVLSRGFAKTTNLRAFASKRIAYGISRTIVYVGKSEKHARRSVRWLRTQVEKNTAWAKAFGLNKGQPWTDEELHILHGPEQHSIWVLALGISGSTRGINIDDYRPDLIIVDDVVDGENSATAEQREKIYDLVMADLKDSLAPASEAPDAKMVLLNTPQDFEDVSQRAIKDNQFFSARFGCWTLETENLPTEFRISSWPERESSEVLRADREASIRRNKLSLFTKEKECKLISPETCDFRDSWVNYFGEGTYEPDPPKAGRWVEIAIDPVPPPTEIQIKKGFAKKDYEAFVVACRYDGSYYILETVYNRGHEPNWTIATFFRLCIKYNPRKIIVETVAYQKTLEWLLREAMRAQGRYWVITPFDDKRAKRDVIVDGLAGPASNGQLFFRRDQTELLSQFLHYPGKNPDGDHDDVLNAAAIVTASLEKGNTSILMDEQLEAEEAKVPALEYIRGAP